MQAHARISQGKWLIRWQPQGHYTDLWTLGPQLSLQQEKPSFIMLQRGLVMCCRKLGQQYGSDTAVPSPLQNFGYACQFLSQRLPWRITSHTHQCLNYYLADGLSSRYPLPKVWIRLHGKWLHPYIIPALHISVYSTHLALTTLIQHITPEQCCYCKMHKEIYRLHPQPTSKCSSNSQWWGNCMVWQGLEVDSWHILIWYFESTHFIYSCQYTLPQLDRYYLLGSLMKEE